MDPSSGKMDEDKKGTPFEEALDQTGFGVYNVLHIFLAGLTAISYACIGYSSSIVVPTSACELQTTPPQQGLLAATPLIGSILGVFVWGYLADTRGRRSTLMVSLALSAAVNAAASLSVNWVMLTALQLVASGLSSGLLPLSVTLLSECVPAARRNTVMQLIASIFLLAQGVMAALAIPIIPLTFSHYMPALGIYWNSWRLVVLVFTLPSLTCLCWLALMQESPKFLVQQGREREALVALRAIHRVNHWGKDGFEVSSLLPESSAGGAGGPTSTLEQVAPLFRAPLLKYTAVIGVLSLIQQIVAFLVWTPTILNQILRTLETGEGADLPLCDVLNLGLSGDGGDLTLENPCALNVTSLLMVLGVGVMQSIINIGVTTGVGFTGRRNMVVIVALIAGVCGILINLIPNIIASGVLFAVYLTGIVLLGLYNSIAVALFPTKYRALAVSVMMAFARVGSFATIQILNFMITSGICNVAFYVFASLFTSSALIVLLLPDDRKLMKQNQLEPATKVEEVTDM